MIAPPAVAVIRVVTCAERAVAAAPSRRAVERVPPPDTAAGTNPPLTPGGRLPADSRTAEVNPGAKAMVTASWVAVPARSATAGLVTVTENGATVMDANVVCEIPPPDARKTMLYWPGVMVAAAVRARVTVPEPGADTVLEVQRAVTPLGSSAVLSVMLELNPPLTEVITGIDTVPPRTTAPLNVPVLSRREGTEASFQPWIRAKA